MERKKAGYSIGAVAEMYGVHPQTLRTYEREGLLKPQRSGGNTRLFTDQDLQRLDLILALTRDLGVNLAGVEVILHMREKMEAMQKEVGELLEYVERRFGVDTAEYGERVQDALVRVSPTQLAAWRRSR
jgi:MerR family transcriptional regulator/heat shock protein HspR